MTRLILAKTGRALLTLVLAVVVVFLGIRAIPGDVALALAGTDSNLENLAAVRARYGLDQPLPVQLARYFGTLLQGDLGRSASSGLRVTEVIGRALPVTLELSVLALLIAVIAGLLSGVIAAVRAGRPADWAVSSVGLTFLAVPNFWLGMMAILLFAVKWQVLPASGFVPLAEDPVENLRRMVLPATIMATGMGAIIMRQTRSSMIEALSQDFIRTAQAKGVGQRAIVFRHALRSSLIVVVTIVGLQLGGLISGAVITEQIFVIPGLGKLTIDAVFTRDYPMIQGLVIIVAAAYILINLLTDIAYTLIDPRIRTGVASHA
jgi:peptide/nickel transport system permease protein